MNFDSYKITGLKFPSGYDLNNMWRDLSQMREREMYEITLVRLDTLQCVISNPM